jgi:uncharacterized protein with HEPN domain
MPRGSELYLNDIQEAIQNIDRFIAGLNETEFVTDKLRLHSTLYNLVVIGEAVKNLPDEMQARVPAVPWRDIERFRDKLVYHYFSIKLAVVWQIVQEDLPILKTAVKALLQDLKDDANGEK